MRELGPEPQGQQGELIEPPPQFVTRFERGNTREQIEVENLGEREVGRHLPQIEVAVGHRLTPSR